LLAGRAPSGEEILLAAAALAEEDPARPASPVAAPGSVWRDTARREATRDTD
jgi:hypothetical protein